MNKEDFVCSKPDCTFAITGTCFDSIDDPSRNCPHLQPKANVAPTVAPDDPSDDAEAIGGAARQFDSGLELGLQDVARIMRSRYATLVGVLGQVEAGKTCLFTSIYLQITGRFLYPQYRFVTSETLLGFEQRARHLRDWSNGGVPDQIVDRTQLGDSRSPAFLHLAISDRHGVRHDFLLPDLPGEWTTRLLSDASTAERFAFLSRSDVLLIVLEAPKFAAARARKNALTDATHLITRLANDIQLPRSIPIILAVTKCDETGGRVPAEVSRVADLVSQKGYSVATVGLAAFPADPAHVPAGFGIDTLLSHLTSPPPTPEDSAIPSINDGGRSYLKARGK